MKKAKTYENVVKRFYRPEIYTCPACHKSLTRAVTVSQRIVVTFAEVIKMTHGGYRCLNPQCEARGRTYRSAAADALVLPRMTFGLDVVLWVGQLRLGNHQTLDEIHASVRERLARLGVSISRREVMYLFDAFCALLRAASLAKEDQEWRSEVAKNAGIIVSIDGIKPDGGNETIYLVRDALPRAPAECRKCQRQFGGEAQTGSRACCRSRHSRAWNHQRCTKRRGESARRALASCAPSNLSIPRSARSKPSWF